MEQRKTVYGIRRFQHDFEKHCIGSYLAYYLRTNAAYLPIAVDGGSTNWHVLWAIHRDIEGQRPTVSQVLTNHLDGIYLAHKLRDGLATTWYCTGGVLRASRMNFIDGAETAFQQRDYSVAVVGCNGFDPPKLSTSTPRELLVKTTMIARAGKSVIWPIDSSKWGVPAGQHLCTLDEMVSWRKKVILVTCYPVQDNENNEADDVFRERIKRFQDTVIVLTRQWQYNLKAFTAPVSKGEVEFTETELVRTSTLLAGEIREAHARSVPPGQERQIGLIVRFDLWGNPC